MTSIKIIQPFDSHLHLRTGKMAELVTPLSAKQFSDVIVMPNLTPPIVTVDQALIYKSELENYATCNYHMALYLTESTTVEEVIKVSESPFVIGFKLYPLNATTGSQNGIFDIKNIYHLFEAMQKYSVPLLIHGEVTKPEIDIFDRESRFICDVLSYLVEDFPSLKITLEHITTSEAVIFVNDNPIVATITPHHLLINRNSIFTVDEKTALNPHNFCLPIAKAEANRLALVHAATSGNPKFFAGTDSAPHPLNGKLSNCGCAGCFTGLHAVELYTTVFEKAGVLDKLENFLSVYGRNHYGIKIPDDKLNIVKANYTIPETIGDDNLTPFMYGKTLNWKVLEEWWVMNWVLL